MSSSWRRSACVLIVFLALSISGPSALASDHPPAPLPHPAYPAQTTIYLYPNADAGIESPRPDTNVGAEPYLPVYYQGFNEYGRSLLFFNLAGQIPADAIVDSATLYLYLNYAHTAGPMGLTVKTALQEWTEPRVTWTSWVVTPPIPKTGNPSYINLMVDETLGYKSLDVTGIVASWLQGTNYGLEVSGLELGDIGYQRIFNSREAADNWPQLGITYHLPPPPPGNWSNFTPTDWVKTKYPTARVQVQLGGTGLDVGSAQYQYSIDGGMSWSPWAPAECDGADGSTAPQYVSVEKVPFGQDTLTPGQNRVRFLVYDLSANPFVSPDFYVYLDTMPPSYPANLTATRPTYQWSNQPNLTLSWSGAADASSGVAGYSVFWTTAEVDLPDTTVDLTGLSQATAIPGEGDSWYFHVRVVDAAGNWSVGAASLGPFYLDTTPPENPTGIYSTSHPGGSAWSNNNMAACQWPDGADTLSGIAGYSVVWDEQNATVPDASIDTTGPAAFSTPLDDGPNWWLHVRAVDRAGNAAAGSLGYGPLRIDTMPPLSRVFPLDPYQGTGQWLVEWSGNSYPGAPITGYDIRVVGTSPGAANLSEWFTGTTATSATFTSGLRGRTYTFYSRARDAAGNQEEYPTIGVSTTVGSSHQIRVCDKYGTPIEGASVYHLGAFAGKSNANGTVTLDNAMLGDSVAAIAVVKTGYYVSPKGTHGGGGNPYSWGWRTYITNVSFDTQGNPLPGSVTTIHEPQPVYVLPNWPLIGFHLVVSVGWDADATYLNDLVLGLRQASAYLYDVTDGQFYWEVIDVYDNSQHWDDADMHIMAYPLRAHARVWGITEGGGAHITMGRMDYSLQSAFRVMIHEFGHYGLGLWDEYVDRNGDETTGAFCTDPANSTTALPDHLRASLMDDQDYASELCSRVDPNHLHQANTRHDAKSGGETTWQTVLGRFGDGAYPARWILTSPDTRGYTLAGPNALVFPITELNVHDANTGACAPFTFTARDSSGFSMPGAEVYVNPTGWYLPPHLITSGTYQGQTNVLGDITIVGAHNGDIIGAWGKATLLSQPASLTPVQCTPAAQSADLQAAAVLAPQPFTLEVTFAPLDATAVQVCILPSVSLPQPPIAVLALPGVDNGLPIALAWNQSLGLYTGDIALPAGTAPAGLVMIRAQDGAGRVVEARAALNLEPISAAEQVTIESDDGQIRVAFAPGALGSDAAAGIQRLGAAPGDADGVVRVTPAYQVVTSIGESILSTEVIVTMGYQEALLGDVDPSTLRVHRYDAPTGIWVSLGGTLNRDHHVVGVRTRELGTFALFGSGTRIYLPTVSRAD